MHQTGYDALYEMYMHVILEHKFMLIWGRIYFSFWGKPYSKVNLLQNQAYATLILIPSKILSIIEGVRLPVKNREPYILLNASCVAADLKQSIMGHFQACCTLIHIHDNSSPFGSSLGVWQAGLKSPPLWIIMELS